MFGRLRSAAVLTCLAVAGMLLLPSDAVHPPRFGRAVPVAVVDDFQNPGVLIGRTFAYVDEPGVFGVDAVTGDRRWTVPITAFGEARLVSLANLILGPPDAAPTVYLAAFVSLPSELRRDTVHVLALDPASGARRWSARIDVPSGAVGKATTLVGVGDDTVVFRLSGVDGSVAYAVDTRTHRLRWVRHGVEAVYVDGPVVVAEVEGWEDRRKLVGMRTSNGDRLWEDGPHGHGFHIESLGNGVLHVDGDSYDEDYFVRFIRAATGDSAQPKDFDDRLDQCVFDQRDTIVCGPYHEISPEHAFVIGYDVTSFRERWRREGVHTPLIDRAWNGTMYGTLDDRPVALDGRTGRIVDLPAIEPLLTNQHSAVTVDLDTSEVLLHPVS
ncbi:outer membrane protein assembly factor BamB family protein [Cryptosporangium minutisporangium]|uniref:Pyrrolo-quinoline quinone repeat domain-containing protein n=1 Tax=Cryptosporangium minutisporangium TaxID=113569 RepID=A0ABP6TBC5_9ACTN